MEATNSGGPAIDRMVGRDWIALLAAIAVDLGILILTLIRPRAGGQTFMSDQQADNEARGQLAEILRRHRVAASQAFYEMHFSMGRAQYVAIPDTHWNGPEGASPRDFHLAMGALAPRLAARRMTNPSSRLLSLAAERLNRTGWAPPGRKVRDDRTGSWRDWLDGWTKGSVLPNHPLIFEIGEQDRNLAIGILDKIEGEEQTNGRVRQHRPWFDSTEAAEWAPEPKPARIDAPVDQNMIESLYAAVLSHREQGLFAEAEGLMEILRKGVNQLAEQQIEVRGLDDMVGEIFDPNSPFTVVRQRSSDLPRGVILEVPGLAFIRRDEHGARTLKDGLVVTSAGPEPGRRRARKGRASETGPTTDLRAWLPTDD